MIFAPTLSRRRDGKSDSANFGEFQRIRKQVLQYLLQALRVGDHASSKMRIGLDFEAEAPVLRFVPERASDCIQQAGKEYFFGFHRYGSGFDLGKIQKVGEPVQQVRSRTGN